MLWDDLSRRKKGKQQERFADQQALTLQTELRRKQQEHLFHHLEKLWEDGRGSSTVLAAGVACKCIAKYLLVVADINYGSLQAIIWVEATYPPGAKRWESPALLASDISIPPLGRGSFRSHHGVFFALAANRTGGLVRRGHLP